MNIFQRYSNWLHLQWPSGTPERLPITKEHGRTQIPGAYIVGDLSGIPLLKMALASGADAISDVMPTLGNRSGDTDILVIGGGVAGVAAAIEAKRNNLSVEVLESNQLFATIANFPKGKKIFTYPTDMVPQSTLQVSADSKEALLAELYEQAQVYDIQPISAVVSHIRSTGNSIDVVMADGSTRSCKAAIIAIGRSGNYRKLNIPGEEHDKVSNRLHDPAAFASHHVCVIGGGDSACEAAIAIAEQQTEPHSSVTLAYRGSELNRPKAGNIARVMELAQQQKINLQLASQPTEVTADEIVLRTPSGEQRFTNDAVLTMLGREAPLDFFRRSGIAIRGENSWSKRAALIAFLIIITCVYALKGGIGTGLGGGIGDTLASIYATLNPGNIANNIIANVTDTTSLWYVLLTSAKSPGFWVTIAYSSAVVGFGIARIKRRRTPYVTRQTLTLMSIQVLPLFLIPELLLPWLHANGMMPQLLIDNLFPGESWWRAYGFILAWPLMAWNMFNDTPLWWWLGIGCFQTFVIIPFIVWRWGKGAYCGWVCSCGALAETMGDTHREKMPHGKIWNKLNFIGQAILFFAFVLFGLFIISWSTALLDGQWVYSTLLAGVWKPVVDWILAGALGTGVYFWLSGRVWCRFACPLAALMHMYARFSKFRIVVDQKKCISCNACTSVCHQGIDIMNFANKGLHMEDPECVRCSACVQTCPTDVLHFGQVDSDNNVIRLDRLSARTVDTRQS